MWKELVVGYLEVLSRHLRVEADDKNGNPKSSRYAGQGLNSVPPKYDVRMLSTQPRRPNVACLTKRNVSVAGFAGSIPDEVIGFFN
jgi:hypothetical protein